MRVIGPGTPALGPAALGEVAHAAVRDEGLEPLQRRSGVGAAEPADGHHRGAAGQGEVCPDPGRRGGPLRAGTLQERDKCGVKRRG